MTTHPVISEFAVFDTETTGVNPFGDRIVTATVLVMNNAGELLTSVSWVINPGIPIPAEASKVHGITDNHVQSHGQDPKTGLQAIHDSLYVHIQGGLPIVGFNAPFDFTILREDMKRNGLEMRFTEKDIVVIDPMVIDKHVDQYRRGKRTLTSLAEHYGVPFDNAHDAEADCIATGHVLLKIIDKYKNISSMPFGELYDSQVTWSDEQNASYIGFRRKSDPKFDTMTGWPFLKSEVVYEAPKTKDLLIALADKIKAMEISPEQAYREIMNITKKM